MRKIKFLLEYQCLPIWVYGSDGELISNGLTHTLQIELGDNINIKIKELQKKYDSLFENNEVYFEYKGFQNDNERIEFVNESKELIKMIKSKISIDYVFEVKTDLSKL